VSEGECRCRQCLLFEKIETCMFIVASPLLMGMTLSIGFLIKYLFGDKALGFGAFLAMCFQFVMGLIVLPWIFYGVIRPRIIAGQGRILDLPTDTKAYGVIRVLYLLSPISLEGCAQYLKEMRGQWSESRYGRTHIAVLTYYTVVQCLLNNIYLHFCTVPYQTVRSWMRRIG
jgi:hypothetical protein